MEWDDLRVVLAVCRAGSLSGAAKALKLNKSTVFRQINAIEKKMGVRFFERLPQGYQMTEAGEMVMHTAQRMEADVNNLQTQLLGKDFRLQGNIRVTAPEGIAMAFLAPLMAEFCQIHPDIDIDLITTSAALELSRREADLAIRVTRKPPDTSLGKRVSAFNFGIYASPDYLCSRRSLPLNELDWLLADDEVYWLGKTIWKNKTQAAQQTKFVCSSTLVTMNAVKQGLGVMLLPCFLGDNEKDLERVTEPLEELSSELWILTHQDLRHTARVKALMNYFYDGLREKSNKLMGI